MLEHLSFPLDSNSNLYIGVSPNLEAALVACQSSTARRFGISRDCTVIETTTPGVVLIDEATGPGALIVDCGESSIEDILIDSEAPISYFVPEIVKVLVSLLAVHGTMSLVGCAERVTALSQLFLLNGLLQLPGNGARPSPQCCNDGLLRAVEFSLLSEPASDHVTLRLCKIVPSMIHIAMTMLSPVGGVSDVRVGQPATALSGSAEVRTYLMLHNDPPPNVPGNQKIMILHRPLLAGGMGLLQLVQLIRDGWLMVCEFDDNPKQMTILQARDIHNFDGVHGVQTTTETLAKVLREENPEIAVFENAVAELPEPCNFVSDDKITLIYSGINRENEWPPFLSALNRVMRQFESRLHCKIIGDVKLYEALETPNKRFFPLCDYATYLSHLASAEIALMPLAETPFNCCKSDLKFLEASAHRVMSVASRTVYERTVSNHVTGLLFDKPSQLERHLNDIMNHPRAACRLADRARYYVREHRMLAELIIPRISWYRRLLENRLALHSALLDRIPAMRSLLPK